jgi:hypothetical protein
VLDQDAFVLTVGAGVVHVTEDAAHPVHRDTEPPQVESIRRTRGHDR